MSATRNIPRRYRNVTAESPVSEQLCLLGHLIRTKQATPEEIARYDVLEGQEHVPTNALRAWYDLPVAAKMWAADARDLGVV